MDHLDYTDRERRLAESFDVAPQLIRELTDVAQRIRQGNVASRSNALYDRDPHATGFLANWCKRYIL
jgi:hypothetical protein